METTPKPNILLVRARKARGWTQQQLAKELQIGVDTVRAWERGRHVPSLAIRPALTALFGLSLEELGFVDGGVEVQETLSTAEPEAPEGLTRRGAAAPEALSASYRDRRNRRLLIGRMKTTWIEGVFKKSLYQAALLALDLQEYPEALANPWRLAVQETTNVLPSLLAPGTPLLQVYDEAEGQLLLLGEPGAGKTTLLLDLAGKLLQRAEQDVRLPVPVAFNLSSWTRQTDLATWLVGELHSKYQVARSVAQTWIDEGQIAVLLDGLDETDEDIRSACVQAINQYQQEQQFASLLVCCRREEYFAQPTRVEAQRAILIQPLLEEQIDEYLALAGGRLAGVRQALLDDAELRAMVQTPLMLAVVALAYQDKREIVLSGSLEERRGQVFQQYIQTMLTRRGMGRYAPQATTRWLAWLARQMNQHQQAVFYMERLQPDWLEERDRKKYRLRVTRVYLGLHTLFSSALIACFRGDFIPQELGLFSWLGGGKGNSVLGWMSPGIGGAEQGATSFAFLFTVIIFLLSLLAQRDPFDRQTLRAALRVGLQAALRAGGVLSVLGGLIFGVFNFTHENIFLRVSYGIMLGLFIGICFGVQMVLARLFRHPPQRRKGTFSWKDRLGNALLFFGCGFTGFAAIYSWEAGKVDMLALAYGCVAGGLFAVVFNRGDEAGYIHQVGVLIRPVETSVWSWRAVGRDFQRNVKNAVLLALLLFASVGSFVIGLSGLFYGVSYGVRYGLVYGSILGAAAGLAGLLISSLTSGWSNDLLEDTERLVPNEGIRRSWRNALLAAGLGAPVGGISIGLVSGLIFALAGIAGWPILGTGLGIIFTLGIAFDLGTFYGGQATMEHYLMRSMLQHQGVMPQNMTFYDYGVERILLRRVGGGYIFIHRLLLEYFRTLEE